MDWKSSGLEKSRDVFILYKIYIKLEDGDMVDNTCSAPLFERNTAHLRSLVRLIVADVLIPVLTFVSMMTVYQTSEAKQQDCLNSDIKMPAFWQERGPIPTESLASASTLREVPKELVADRAQIAVDKKMYQALIEMLTDASRANIRIEIASGYRSPDKQERIVQSKVKNGVCAEEIFSAVAPTGFSTHSTGMAVDFAPANSKFAKTKAYRWLKNNSNKYGFNETYFQGNKIGVIWEPWHFDFTSR